MGEVHIYAGVWLAECIDSSPPPGDPSLQPHPLIRPAHIYMYTHVYTGGTHPSGPFDFQLLAFGRSLFWYNIFLHPHLHILLPVDILTCLVNNMLQTSVYPKYFPCNVWIRKCPLYISRDLLPLAPQSERYAATMPRWWQWGKWTKTRMHFLAAAHGQRNHWMQERWILPRLRSLSHRCSTCTPSTSDHYRICILSQKQCIAVVSSG